MRISSHKFMALLGLFAFELEAFGFDFGPRSWSESLGFGSGFTQVVEENYVSLHLQIGLCVRWSTKYAIFSQISFAPQILFPPDFGTPSYWNYFYMSWTYRNRFVELGPGVDFGISPFIVAPSFQIGRDWVQARITYFPEQYVQGNLNLHFQFEDL